VTITTEPCPGTHDRVWTTYAALPHDVAPGNRILIDDGNIALEVVAVEADGVPALPPLTEAPWTPGGAIARAAADVASVLGARALVVFTTSGEGAHRLSRHRPLTPLLAYTPDPVVRSVMALTWGGGNRHRADARRLRRHGVPGQRRGCGWAAARSGIWS